MRSGPTQEKPHPSDQSPLFLLARIACGGVYRRTRRLLFSNWTQFEVRFFKCPVFGQIRQKAVELNIFILFYSIFTFWIKVDTYETIIHKMKYNEHIIDENLFDLFVYIYWLECFFIWYLTIHYCIIVQFSYNICTSKYNFRVPGRVLNVVPEGIRFFF